MRFTVLAFVLCPLAAQAQDTTITLPADDVAQSQSCPVGMVWSAEANACAIAAQSGRPMDMLGEPGGCASGHAAREVTS